MLMLKHYRNPALSSFFAPVLWIQCIKTLCGSNLDLRYFIFLLINSPLRLSNSEVHLKVSMYTQASVLHQQ